MDLNAIMSLNLQVNLNVIIHNLSMTLNDWRERPEEERNLAAERRIADIIVYCEQRLEERYALLHLFTF